MALGLALLQQPTPTGNFPIHQPMGHYSYPQVLVVLKQSPVEPQENLLGWLKEQLVNLYLLIRSQGIHIGAISRIRYRKPALPLGFKYLVLSDQLPRLTLLLAAHGLRRAQQAQFYHLLALGFRCLQQKHLSRSQILRQWI
jgi:hypothetical protein